MGHNTNQLIVLDYGAPAHALDYTACSLYKVGIRNFYYHTLVGGAVLIKNPLNFDGIGLNFLLLEDRQNLCGAGGHLGSKGHRDPFRVIGIFYGGVKGAEDAKIGIFFNITEDILILGENTDFSPGSPFIPL